MLRDPLDEVLASKARLRILRLHLTSLEVHSTREMARRTGMSKRAMDLALAELVDLGLMVREPGVSWAPYRVNRNHELVQRVLVPLFAGEIGYVESQVQALRELVDAALGDAGVELHWAGVFGSVARSEATAGSDLDLALIVESDGDVGPVRDRSLDLVAAFERRFGRHVSVLVLSANQFRLMYMTPDSVAHAMVREGRRLAGERDLEALVGDTKGELETR